MCTRLLTCLDVDLASFDDSGDADGSSGADRLDGLRRRPACLGRRWWCSCRKCLRNALFCTQEELIVASCSVDHAARKTRIRNKRGWPSAAVLRTTHPAPVLQLHWEATLEKSPNIGLNTSSMQRLEKILHGLQGKKPEMVGKLVELCKFYMVVGSREHEHEGAAFDR